jgi:hypothetical protein
MGVFKGKATAGKRRGFRKTRIALFTALTLVVAGVLALRTALAFDAPEEFYTQKGELEAVQIEPAGSDSLYDAFSLTLTSSAGYSVRGHLRVPQGEGPWPSLIVIGGVRTGRMAAELITPETPYVILGLDYPWDGPRQLTWFQFLLRVLAVRRAMLLTPSAVSLAVDYLETRPEVDASGPVFAGASFGAQLIAVAGALDKRASSVLVISGGGAYEAILEANLADIRPAWLRSGLARAGAWLLDPVEPLHYADQVAPRPFILINGLDDGRVPRSCVEGLYDRAKHPKRLIWLQEGHISSRNPELLGRVLHAAARALNAESAGEVRRSGETG